ncbi:low molecular weight protein-tyrosine-phosphatase [Ferrovibrio sp.]|uniref:low molecular weight protein-tyrosine-phosphatase n=1 Tax=Ferrovibrio sp. TaxID=1917215 RepID=UPI00311D5928
MTHPDVPRRPLWSVLMVCTGNICRSPTADGLLRHALHEAGLQDLVLVDSAGTHGYHVGEPPDPRSVATARQYGVDLAPLRARKVAADDFTRFDRILAMDQGHLQILQKLCPQPEHSRLKLYLDYAPRFGREVPDPYYGGPEGFEAVWQMCMAATAALMTEIRNRPGIANESQQVSGK